MPPRNWTLAAIERRKAENAKLRQRVIAPAEHGPRSCFVVDCRKPSGDSTPGLLGRFCKKHGNDYRRHGSPLRPSYAASETNPNRRAALSWLKANQADHFVQLAIGNVLLRYQSAGPEIEPRSLKGTTPKQKADAVWARLRLNGADPLYVLAAIAGVTMTFDADPQQPSGAWGKEYRQVQIAKVLMRLAGGEVKRWARKPVVVDAITGRTERPPPQELKVFPASTGRVLRVVGKEADDVGEFITWLHLAAIKEHAATLPLTEASMKTPWPDRQPAKPKPRIPEEVKPTGSYAAQAIARKQRQQQRDRDKRAAALASIITPEQDAARQPTVKEFRGGRWVDAKPKDGA